MSTEAQILALFEEGNPIPDIEGVEKIDLDAAAYLATLQTRSSAMTQTRTEPVEEKVSKPIMRWVAAAAVAVVLGVILILTGQNSQETPPVDQPTPVPPTTAAPTPTTVAVPTTAAGPSTVEAGPTDEELIAVSAEWLTCVSIDCGPSIAPLGVDGLSLPGGGPSLDEFLAYQQAVAVVVSDVSCDAVTAGGTVCTRTSTDAASRVWGWEYEETFRFFFDGSTITSLNYSNEHPETIDAYFEWLDETYPSESFDCFASPGDPQTCLAFFESHMTEFEQSDAWIPPNTQ